MVGWNNKKPTELPAAGGDPDSSRKPLLVRAKPQLSHYWVMRAVIRIGTAATIPTAIEIGKLSKRMQTQEFSSHIGAGFLRT